MAKILKNDKRFLIIEMPWREYVAITDSWGLADCCGQNTSEENVYYIAVLNQFYCGICFNAWISTAMRYKSDLEKEQYNFVKMKGKLEDLGTWE